MAFLLAADRQRLHS